MAWFTCQGQQAAPSTLVLSLVLLYYKNNHVFTGGRAIDVRAVASDPSAFPQGSIQQLTIHRDPRTPEELCEAEESWVSPPSPHPDCLTTPQRALQP